MRPAASYYWDRHTSQYSQKENINISSKEEIFDILLEKLCDCIDDLELAFFSNNLFEVC